MVSGSSGFIGSELLPALRREGWEVVQLVRGPNRAGMCVSWDPLRPLNPETVSGFDAVIHLAGESIFGRWSDSKKQRILESRVEGTRHLAQALAVAKDAPSVLVSGSAIGFYGDRGDEVLREESHMGKGFLADVAGAWEAAAEAAEARGIRVVHPRTGIVLGAKGGALKPTLTLFRLGLGGRIGNGRQWWSWISLADMVKALLHILGNDSLHGPVNMAAPNPVTNAQFTKTLGEVLSRPEILPVPAFLIRGLMGQMGREVLLGSQRVEPAKLLQSGFQFENPELREALSGILQRPGNSR